MEFKPAVKHEAKGRVALVGPAGAGKSMTALILARLLVGPEGKIAAVDTEHGSLSKYAGEPYPNDPTKTFQFDVLELESFSPDNFMKALTAAEQAGYGAFVCDSLSHFWVGKDGALEFVDMAAKRYKDNMGGWKEFRPHERAMVDRMIASPCHVVVTMRTKTDYQEQVNPTTGKKQRVKVGLAPVQREGLEYEFDLVSYMDEENTFITDKTRCSFYSKKALTAPGEKEFLPFKEWLKGAPRPPKPAPDPAAATAAKAAPAAANPVKTGVFKVSSVTSHKSTKAGQENMDVFQTVLIDGKEGGGAFIMKTADAAHGATLQAAEKDKADVTVSWKVMGAAKEAVAVIQTVEILDAAGAAQ